MGQHLSAAAARKGRRPAEAAWRVVAASVQGTAHARGGLPCQDAHAWRLLPGGALAVAVADGAGTAAHADAGARAAVDAAVESLAASLDVAAGFDGWTGAIDRALEAALAAVEAEAVRLSADARELAATLIVAVASGDGIAAAQVGDGAVIAEDGEGCAALTTPTSGEFANETVFLTSPDALASAQRAARRRPPDRLAVLTDGLQPLALRMPSREPHEPFFAPLFRFAAEHGGEAEASSQLAAFLSGPRVTARADDDLTLVLAARQP